jgi:hypothetical protein
VTSRPCPTTTTEETTTMPGKTTLTVRTVADTAHLQATARTVARHLTALADDLVRLDQAHGVVTVDDYTMDASAWLRCSQCGQLLTDSACGPTHLTLKVDPMKHVDWPGTTAADG